jgi:hypothetical protein
MSEEEYGNVYTPGEIKQERFKCDQARNSNTSIEILAELAKDKSKNVRCAVAQNPNISDEILIKFARDADEDVGVRYWAIWNSRMPAEVLAEIVTSDNPGIKHAIARHPNASAEVLIKLTEDKSVDVVHWVVRNPNCPVALKMWLKAGGYAGMTLAEFIAGTQETL